jgi:hypothetical protein
MLKYLVQMALLMTILFPHPEPQDPEEAPAEWCP